MLTRDNSDDTIHTAVRADRGPASTPRTSSAPRTSSTPSTAHVRSAEAGRADVRRFAGDPISSPALLAGLAWSGSRLNH